MKRVFPRIFLPLVCLLYACFLVLDLTALADSTWIKYVSILLCFSAALLNHSCQDGRLVVLALLFTAAADWFLLVQNRNYLFGVSLFCIVQFIYSIRLYRLRGEAVLCIASIPHTAFVGVLFRYRYAFRAFGLLFFPTWLSTHGKVRFLRSCGRKHRLFACGLLLFVVCCDPLRRRMESGDLPVLHAFWHVALLFCLHRSVSPFHPIHKEQQNNETIKIPVYPAVSCIGGILSVCRNRFPYPVPPVLLSANPLASSSPSGLAGASRRSVRLMMRSWIIWCSTRPFGTGDLAWSEDGQAHFADCKILFQQDFVLLGGSAAALVLLALLGHRCGLRFYRFRGRGPAFWSAAAMGVVYLITAIWAFCDFNSMFTVFRPGLFSRQDQLGIRRAPG